MTALKQAAIFWVAAFMYVILLLCAISPGELVAQTPADVRDVRPATPGTAVDVPNPIKPVPAATISINEKLFNQLQILQQEVLELRGQVELQSHEIKKLKQQRLDDYLDLDRRIGEISPSSTESVDQTTRSVVSDTLKPPVPSASVSGKFEPGEDERVRYRKAIDQVLKQQDYQSAQMSFSDYLARYPKGYYTPNVYYWQGEIFLLQDETDKAVNAFTALIEQYPNHSKVYDAKYKLAKIYFRQGKKEEAKFLLEAVVQSSTDASRLAQSFLDSNY